MDAVVVYESLFGYTRAIADTTAAGVRGADPGARVALMCTVEATPGVFGEADLLIVAGPTQIMRMRSERTRQRSMQAAEKRGRDQGRRGVLEPGSAGPGVREWLRALLMARPGNTAAAVGIRSLLRGW